MVWSLFCLLFSYKIAWAKGELKQAKSQSFEKNKGEVLSVQAQRKITSEERVWEGLVQSKWGISFSSYFVNLSTKLEADYKRNKIDVPEQNGFALGMFFSKQREGDLMALGFFTNFFGLPRRTKVNETSHREATFHAISLGSFVQQRLTKGEHYEMFGSLAWGFGVSEIGMEPLHGEKAKLTQKFYQLEPGFGWDFNRMYRVGISMKVAYPFIFILSNKRSGAIYSEASKVMEAFKLELNLYLKSNKCHGTCYSSEASLKNFFSSPVEPQKEPAKEGLNYSKKKEGKVNKRSNAVTEATSFQ